VARPHLEAAAEVRLAVTGDYAYIQTYWRAKAGGPDEDGVPTSYYAAAQFVCRPTVVDDPQGKAEILEHRQRVIGHLDQRGHGLDAGAAIQQRRRLAAIGDWKTYRDRP
jgi:transcriptional regulator